MLQVFRHIASCREAARETVARSFRNLASERLVGRRRKIGTVVTGQARDRPVGWVTAVFLFAPANLLFILSPVIVFAGFPLVGARWAAETLTQRRFTVPQYTTGRHAMAVVLVMMLWVSVTFMVDATWGDEASGRLRDNWHRGARHQFVEPFGDVARIMPLDHCDGGVVERRHQPDRQTCASA